MTRDEMIEHLVDDDINEILDAARDSNFEVIAYTLELGFKGYVNYTDEELAGEIAEREAMAEYMLTV